jgi:hypothetical protein
MLRRLIGVAVLATAGTAGSAVPGHAQQMKAPTGVQRTITGTVIDVSCKFGQGLTGTDHQMCAGVCADKGIPLAILTDDGKLYLAISPAMPGEPQNARLKEFAETRVTVSGKVFTAGGASAIQVDRIAKS